MARATSLPQESTAGNRDATFGVAITFLTVLVLVSTTAYSIAYAEWMPGLSVVIWACVFGTLAGTALAFSSFPRWTAHLAGLIYGLFVIVLIGGSQPDIAILDDWRERVFLMLDKVIVWSREAINNGSSRETLIFFLMLSGLFWVLSYSAAWYSFRTRRIWHVILPSGVTLFSNIYYYAGEKSMVGFLVVFLLCVVVLLALSHLADREESWLRNRIRFQSSLRAGFVLTALAIALVSLMFSWRVTVAMTSPTVRQWFGQFNEPYNEFLARWNRMFSTLQNPVARPSDTYQNSFELSGPRSLTEDPVMDVMAPPARYYWRALSYDNYDGRTWSSTLADSVDFPAGNVSIGQAEYQSRKMVRAEFNLQRGTDAVYVPSQPARASILSRAVLDSSQPGAVSIAYLKLGAQLLPGNRYSGWGSVSAATINELRGSINPLDADTAPEWLRRYVQLPEIPGRVLDLGRNITAGQRTDYDKARAIERWLRQNIKYDEKLEAPPAGFEASEYILFETRRAYCNYYATAMIVMLRAQGIPARMAVGYAQGDPQIEEVDADVATYRVRQLDSHAWVEVYFPEYGWVEFEPTSTQPEIPRLENQDNSNSTPTAVPATPTPLPTLTPRPGEATPTPPPQSEAPQTPRSPTLAELLASFWRAFINSPFRYLLLLPLLLGAGYLLLRYAESRGLSHLPMVEKAYAMVSRWASWLGIGRFRHHTPYEQADELGTRAPEARASVQRITEMYVSQRFAPKRVATTPDASSAASVDLLRDNADAQTLWNRTRGRLALAWLSTNLRGALRDFWRRQKIAD
jgi:transglutaminase-like putative cysteine protease